MSPYIGLLACVVVYLVLQWHERALSYRILDTVLVAADDEMAHGVFSAERDPRFTRVAVAYRLGGAVLFCFVRSYVSQVGWVEQGIYLALGALAGEMVLRIRKQRANVRSNKATEFFLPVVMERVVMAVSAGLDILPGLTEASRDSTDPVSRLFSRVVDLVGRGLAVEDALRSVADRSDAPPVKHAFVHLALAHKEGGELVRPLRELSDATQLHYQETVEEEIAKLPVKAVLPLVLTFTGLIICFLTVPLVQVSSLTGKVTQGALE